jgi:hypothetical protein
MPVEKMNSDKWPGIDKILAELFQSGGRAVCVEIHELFASVWNKEE